MYNFGTHILLSFCAAFISLAFFYLSGIMFFPSSLFDVNDVARVKTSVLVAIYYFTMSWCYLAVFCVCWRPSSVSEEVRETESIV